MRTASAAAKASSRNGRCVAEAWTTGALAAPRWRIIDSAETTAARVRRILAVNRLGNDDEGSEAQVETLVTDAPQRFVDTAARLFGDDLPTPRLVDVPSPHMTLAVAR